jgi:putative salt-induced outer membrane protein
MNVLLSFLFLSLSFVAQAQFSNESDLGIASANGNTKTQTYTARQAVDFKWKNNVISFKSRYLHSESNDEEAARYFMGHVRYEKQVTNNLGFYLGETLEKDKFAAIDKRLIVDIGVKYRFIESDLTSIFSELGYRYMDEERIDGSFAFSDYLRSYTEWEHKWNINFSTKYWVELLPNITNQKDWHLNTEFSLSAFLDSVFSLKTGVLLRYDHSPAPGITYTTDTLFTTSLVAKF